MQHSRCIGRLGLPAVWAALIPFAIGSPAFQGPFAKELDNNLIFVEAVQFVAELTPRDGKIARLSVEQWQATGYDKHSLCADPMFVDAVHRNYRVKPDSPELKLGFRNFDLSQVGLLPDFPKSFVS